jgi:hypothetical protein
LGKKLGYSAIVGVLALCAVGGAYRFHIVNVRRAAEAAKVAAQAAKAEHEAALADSAQITAESKAWWDDKNRRARLHNDELRLQNAQLEYDIAGLEDKPRNRSQIENAETAVRNDKLTIDLLNGLDTGEPPLNPYQTDARIAEHNRKYPHDKLAGISDVTKEMESVQSRVEAILGKSNK